MQCVKDLRCGHDQSMQMLYNIAAGDAIAVRKYLDSQNMIALATELKSRSVILVDATYSMSPAINATKAKICTVFNRARTVLREKGIDEQSFEVQIVAYRNYNCSRDTLMQVSPFVRDPQDLLRFMSGVDVDGGWGNEAIEVALSHVNKVKASGQLITQILLIGDAAANTPAEVTQKRDQSAENWASVPEYSTPTNWEVEIASLTSAPPAVPVHAFYIENAARDNFEEIARRTGGRAEKLDVNSAEGDQLLTDCLTEQILENIGGAELVVVYRKTYQS